MKRIVWMLVLPFLFVDNGKECRLNFNGKWLKGSEDPVKCKKIKLIGECMNLAYVLGEVHAGTQEDQTATLTESLKDLQAAMVPSVMSPDVE